MFNTVSELNPRCRLMDVNSVMAILDSISLFGGLTGSQLQCLFHCMRQVCYRSGEAIYRQGDPASSIYIVLEGSVRLVFDTPNHPLTGTELGAGACLGETSVVGIQPHDATSVVLEDVQLLELGKDQLIDLFARDNQLFSQLILNIARETSRRLHRCCELLGDPLNLSNSPEVSGRPRQT